jgi:uncharacterized protein involved in tolerance to divalent cations
LEIERHVVLERNAACIDYSVAKDGFLAAYSWSGEKQLDPKHFTHRRA